MTSPPMSWHPAEAVLQDYVDGRLGALRAGSVEAHLLACSGCRGALAPAVPAPRLVRVRDALDDRLDRAARPWLERLLRRLGVAEDDARALLAAPSLRRGWWLAVVAAAALGLLAADGSHPDAAFLLLAPLVPLGTTALAYAPGLDPAFALVAATPYRTSRLLLARSLAVGVTALLGVALAALALPTRDVTTVVWLLPAVALTLGVLALAPRFGTGPAAAAVSAGWLVLAGVLERRGLDITWVQGPAAQAVCALMAAASVVAVMRQWTRLDAGGSGGGAA